MDCSIISEAAFWGISELVVVRRTARNHVDIFGPRLLRVREIGWYRWFKSIMREVGLRDQTSLRGLLGAFSYLVKVKKKRDAKSGAINACHV